MIFGYARVSTRDQKTAAQHDALTAAESVATMASFQCSLSNEASTVSVRSAASALLIPC